MSAAILDRGRCAPLADLRPCEVRNPDWWVTGNENNATAIMLCQTACRFASGCPAANPDPVGVIVAGVAYDDYNRAVKVCDQCGHPWHQRIAGRPATCMCPRTAADHHKQIVTMWNAGKSSEAMAKATGLSRHTVRNYCHDLAIRAKVGRGEPLARPGDHHQRIEQMRAGGASWPDVAAEIGCTYNSLISYVRIQREKGLIAA